MFFALYLVKSIAISDPISKALLSLSLFVRSFVLLQCLLMTLSTLFSTLFSTMSLSSYREIYIYLLWLELSLADSINTETNKSDKFLGDKFFVSIDKDFQSSPIENLWYKHESNWIVKTRKWVSKWRRRAIKTAKKGNLSYSNYIPYIPWLNVPLNWQALYPKQAATCLVCK